MLRPGSQVSWFERAKGCWILWREEQGWAASAIVRGRTEDAVRAGRLLEEIARDHRGPPPELAQPFLLRDADRRRIVEARTVRRKGQDDPGRAP